MSCSITTRKNRKLTAFLLDQKMNEKRLWPLLTNLSSHSTKGTRALPRVRPAAIKLNPTWINLTSPEWNEPFT